MPRQPPAESRALSSSWITLPSPRMGSEPRLGAAPRRARPRLTPASSARPRSTSCVSRASPGRQTSFRFARARSTGSGPASRCTGSPTESVELSRSERDAFREIARALIGRTPAARGESRASGRNWGSCAGREPPAGPRRRARRGRRRRRRGGSAQRRRHSRPTADRRSDRPRRAPALRQPNAARSHRLSRFRGIQAANGLAAMFRDRDPQRMAVDGCGLGRDRQGRRPDPVASTGALRRSGGTARRRR